jgi:hypothetical protein
MWLEDISKGICVYPDPQLDKFGDSHYYQACYTMEVSWKQNQWLYCERPGYFLTGIEKFGGRGPGLEVISALECCMQLPVPFKNKA